MNILTDDLVICLNFVLSQVGEWQNFNFTEVSSDSAEGLRQKLETITEATPSFGPVLHITPNVIDL